MDPQQNPGPSMHLPPQPVSGHGAADGTLSSTGQPVQGSAAPIAPPPAASAVSWLPPSVPVSPSGQSVQGNVTGQSVGVSAPNIADDGDIIEKELVIKAKQIVERTRHDPYLQTKELHKFKAEYMKKRYNKTIQPVEE